MLPLDYSPSFVMLALSAESPELRLDRRGEPLEQPPGFFLVAHERAVHGQPAPGAIPAFAFAAGAVGRGRGLFLVGGCIVVVVVVVVVVYARKRRCDFLLDQVQIPVPLVKGVLVRRRLVEMPDHLAHRPHQRREPLVRVPRSRASLACRRPGFALLAGLKLLARTVECARLTRVSSMATLTRHVPRQLGTVLFRVWIALPRPCRRLLHRHLDALPSGQDGRFAYSQGHVPDGLDDRVAHVADEDRQGRDGKQGPEDEQRRPGVALRPVVAVADGDEGRKGKVDGLEVGPVLLALDGPEDGGAAKPQQEPDAQRDAQGRPSSLARGHVLQPAHQVELLPTEVCRRGPVGGQRVRREPSQPNPPLLRPETVHRRLSALLREAGSDLLLPALEPERSNGADDQTDEDDASDGVRHVETPTQPGRGREVTEAHGQERDDAPVDRLEIPPALDMRKDDRAEKDVRQEKRSSGASGSAGCSST